MDPISAAALAGLISALVETGTTSALAGLRSLLARRGRRSTSERVDQIIKEDGSVDPGQVEDLADVLARAAEDSPRVREILTSWVEESGPAPQQASGSVTNIFNGQANAPVIQIGQIYGGSSS